MANPYHVFDHELGPDILGDLTKLIAQVGLIYTLTHKEPFESWFFDKGQDDVYHLVTWSVLPAAILTASRLLDKGAQRRSLKALIKEYQKYRVTGADMLLSQFETITSSINVTRLFFYRNESIAHNANASSGRKRLENEGEKLEWSYTEAVKTLLCIAKFTRTTLLHGSLSKNLPNGVGKWDGMARQFALRLVGTERPSIYKEWKEVTGEHRLESIFELKLD